MQIEIYTPTQEQAMPPVAWNYDEVKTWLTESLEKYKGLVYTSDSISQAKSDRAKLNKLADAIDGKRKEMKAYFLAPYEEFEKQAKELTALVKGVSASIDTQVKAFDEERKNKKLEEIRKIYDENIGDLAVLVPYERLHDAKWLNIGTSMSSIETALKTKISDIAAALVVIDNLGLDKDLAFTIETEYLATFDLSAALAKKDRIIEQREALSKIKPTQSISREPQDAPTAKESAQGSKSTSIDQNELRYVDFRVYATPAQLALLKSFLNENRISYGRVPNGS